MPRISHYVTILFSGLLVLVQPVFLTCMWYSLYWGTFNFYDGHSQHQHTHAGPINPDLETKHFFTVEAVFSSILVSVIQQQSKLVFTKSFNRWFYPRYLLTHVTSTNMSFLQKKDTEKRNCQSPLLIYDLSKPVIRSFENKTEKSTFFRLSLSCTQCPKKGKRMQK